MRFFYYLIFNVPIDFLYHIITHKISYLIKRYVLKLTCILIPWSIYISLNKIFTKLTKQKTPLLLL